MSNERLTEVAAGPASHLSFPLDIFLIILRDLEVKDVASLSQCSKELAFLMASRAVWYTLLQTCIIDKFIPIPPLDTPIPYLSAPEIKAVVRRSLLLRDAWTRTIPQATRKRDLSSSFSRAIPSGLAFISGPGNASRYIAYVLTSTEPITGTLDGPRHCFHCVDVSCSEPRVVAWRRYTHPVKFAVNETLGALGLIAVASATQGVLTTSILALDAGSVVGNVTRQDVESEGFVTLSEFPTRGVPLLLRDHVLAVGDQEGNIWLYDARSGALLYELRDPRAPHMNETVRVVLLRDIVLTFGFSTIKLFTLPTPLITTSPESSETTPLVAELTPSPVLPTPPGSSIDLTGIIDEGNLLRKGTVLLPTSEHRWRWRIDTISVSPLVHAYAPPDSPSRTRPSINIFVRFGSWYPWPINMLHHYVLVPSSPQAVPSGSSNTSPIAISSPFTSTQSEHDASPYCLPPTLAVYTYSSLDLFTVSDTSVGPYGTALWTDSQAETGIAASSGAETGARTGWQRVAGKVLRQPLLEAPARPGATVHADADAGADGPPLAASAVAETAAERYDAGKTMVFGAYPKADAYHLAMDEETGRIAVAWRHGGVSIWDFMPQEE
ncbi:hypothetical protein DENSPDRAFT_870746 [Dentipellis sp. KUC8613]|nr:hypothetical protein DENSPDRAFT_870746 [Dentipellis sp. KUC8613]